MGIIKSIIDFFSTNSNQVENENLGTQEVKTVQVQDVNKEAENSDEKKGDENLNKPEKENKGNAKNK